MKKLITIALLIFLTFCTSGHVHAKHIFFQSSDINCQEQTENKLELVHPLNLLICTKEI